MCARYSLLTPIREVVTLFGARAADQESPARYNIAPSQGVPVVTLDQDERVLRFMRWGFLPSWAKEPNKSVVNARSETALEKPFFKNAMRWRRALMPADGFYEWKAEAGGKQPYVFRRPDGRPFAFAALWERWNDPEKGPVDTVALLTTTPNAVLSQVHDRMPVVFADEAAWGRWLDPKTGPEEIQELMRPAPDELLEMRAVSRRLNNPRAEGPELWG